MEHLLLLKHFKGVLIEVCLGFFSVYLDLPLKINFEMIFMATFMTIVCSPVIITPHFDLRLSPLIPSCFPSGNWFSCKSGTSLAQLEENGFLLHRFVFV